MTKRKAKSGLTDTKAKKEFSLLISRSNNKAGRGREKEREKLCVNARSTFLLSFLPSLEIG